MSDEYTNEDVARALGLETYYIEVWHGEYELYAKTAKLDTSPGAINKDERWNPKQNLAQAVRHGVPWLNERGLSPRLSVKWCEAYGVNSSDLPSIVFESGQGNTPDEYMADALCRVILRVAASCKEAD